jgi:hypothetical protein
MIDDVPPPFFSFFTKCRSRRKKRGRDYKRLHRGVFVLPFSFLLPDILAGMKKQLGEHRGHLEGFEV